MGPLVHGCKENEVYPVTRPEPTVGGEGWREPSSEVAGGGIAPRWDLCPRLS